MILIHKKLKADQNRSAFILVPLAGLEPARYRYRWILSPLRLPISPQQHNVSSYILNYYLGFYYIMSRKFVKQKIKTFNANKHRQSPHLLTLKYYLGILREIKS